VGDGIKGRINVGLVLIGIRSVLGIAYTFEELLMSQVIQTGSPHVVAFGEMDIHQGRVFGDGKISQFRDEKKREIRYIYRHRL